MLDQFLYDENSSAFQIVYKNTNKEHDSAENLEEEYNYKLDRYEHLVVKVRKLNELPKRIIKTTLFTTLLYALIVTSVHALLCLIIKIMTFNPSIIFGNTIGLSSYYTFKNISELLSDCSFYERFDIREEYNKLSKELPNLKNQLEKSYTLLISALNKLKEQLETYKSSVNMIGETESKIISSTEHEIESQLSSYTLKLQRL